MFEMLRAYISNIGSRRQLFRLVFEIHIQKLSANEFVASV